ncbi:MAG: FG-GAP repeat protein, partial [Pseudomonadota bacterium]
VYVRSSGFWIYKGYLAANDGAAGDLFGSSVAINGDTALIGANLDDIGTPAGVNPDQGSAYLFTRSGTLWGARQKFTAQGGAAREMFGQAVAISGDKALVSAPHARIGANLSQGAVYIFGCGYTEQTKFAGLGSESGDYFGSVLAMDGDTVVVGAPLDDVGTKSNQGSAYVFVRNGAGWTQSAQLFAHDGAADDHFGSSVAISGDTIVIGAPFLTYSGNSRQGAAYFFVRSGGAWTLQARPFGDALGDQFGSSVSISGNRMAVSSPHDYVGQNPFQGSVTIYTRSGATWSREKVLTANDGAIFDYFGSSVVLSGDRLLVGAPGDEGERSKGAAYVFERSSTQSPS